MPAIAHEAGIEFFLDDVCEIFKETPYFVDLKPGGAYVAKDLYEAGGVPVIMKELRKVRLERKRAKNSSYGTIFNIGELFSE